MQYLFPANTNLWQIPFFVQTPCTGATPYTLVNLFNPILSFFSTFAISKSYLDFISVKIFGLFHELITTVLQWKILREWQQTMRIFFSLSRSYNTNFWTFAEQRKKKDLLQLFEKSQYCLTSVFDIPINLVLAVSLPDYNKPTYFSIFFSHLCIFSTLPRHSVAIDLEITSYFIHFYSIFCSYMSTSWPHFVN